MTGIRAASRGGPWWRVGGFVRGACVRRFALGDTAAALHRTSLRLSTLSSSALTLLAVLALQAALLAALGSRCRITAFVPVVELPGVCAWEICARPAVSHLPFPYTLRRRTSRTTRIGPKNRQQRPNPSTVPR
ncbi:hypothetical protein CANCADRAFT_144642 [Tortispora caseinolytica NRRL Y-17796]|uniref:Uncharacterized protein n=1 Tax=Tortispora caseinolytica NRRL Y-17796 TaxID=767744 RepID=A0A1E4T9J8_9ASCO|nr:hypothetical protein CANCADRAFT_144642 [Tortispora caseinolytica NRRL Y-17796]